MTDLLTAIRDCAGPGQWCPACDQGMGGRCALEPGHADSVTDADADFDGWMLVCPELAVTAEDCDDSVTLADWHHQDHDDGVLAYDPTWGDCDGAGRAS